MLSKSGVQCLCMHVLCLCRDWFCGFDLREDHIDIYNNEKTFEMCICFDCPEVTLCC